MEIYSNSHNDNVFRLEYNTYLPSSTVSINSHVKRSSDGELVLSSYSLNTGSINTNAIDYAARVVKEQYLAHMKERYLAYTTPRYPQPSPPELRLPTNEDFSISQMIEERKHTTVTTNC